MCSVIQGPQPQAGRPTRRRDCLAETEESREGGEGRGLHATKKDEPGGLAWPPGSLCNPVRPGGSGARATRPHGRRADFAAQLGRDLRARGTTTIPCAITYPDIGRTLRSDGIARGCPHRAIASIGAVALDWALP